MNDLDELKQEIKFLLNSLCDIEAVKKYYGEDYLESRKYFFNCMKDDLAQLRDFNYAENECKSIIDQLIEKAA